jgi:hypothetical protein
LDRRVYLQDSMVCSPVGATHRRTKSRMDRVKARRSAS